jgi:hypothetical protein
LIDLKDVRERLVVIRPLAAVDIHAASIRSVVKIATPSKIYSAVASRLGLFRSVIGNSVRYCK